MTKRLHSAPLYYIIRVPWLGLETLPIVAWHRESIYSFQFHSILIYFRTLRHKERAFLIGVYININKYIYIYIYILIIRAPWLGLETLPIVAWHQESMYSFHFHSILIYF